MLSFPLCYLKSIPTPSKLLAQVMTETRAGFKSRRANLVVIGEDVTPRYFWGIIDLEIFSVRYQVVQNIFIYALY